MINEHILVQQYLDGKNINNKLMYRICYLLAKWFKENGLSTSLEIRKAIFNWANKHNVYIDVYLNSCISSALDDGRKLSSDNTIKISDEDINEIKVRFDRNNTRLVALAILCYAKQFATANNKFSISIKALSDWVDIPSSNISSRYLKEITDFGYLTKANESIAKKNTWRNTPKSNTYEYIINVPIINSGNYKLHENDIRDLYNRIFK